MEECQDNIVIGACGGGGGGIRIVIVIIGKDNLPQGENIKEIQII